MLFYWLRWWWFVKSWHSFWLCYRLFFYWLYLGNWFCLCTWDLFRGYRFYSRTSLCDIFLMILSGNTCLNMTLIILYWLLSNSILLTTLVIRRNYLLSTQISVNNWSRNFLICLRIGNRSHFLSSRLCLYSLILTFSFFILF